MGETLFPHLSRQAVIDRLVITGLYALKQPPWQPPELWGRHRDRWRLPTSIAEGALSCHHPDVTPGDIIHPLADTPQDAR